MSKSEVTPATLYSEATNTVKDTNFVEFNKGSRAPIAMLAFAKAVVDKITLNKDFTGLTMTVPAFQNSIDPHYHSTVGQKLLCVDWKRMYGIDVACRRCNKGVFLKNDRTNFSKNKIIFPIFVIDGPPLWCMAMSMTCPCCRWRVNGNDGETLCQLPGFARASYPVETK